MRGLLAAALEAFRPVVFELTSSLLCVVKKLNRFFAVGENVKLLRAAETLDERDGRGDAARLSTAGGVRGTGGGGGEL